VEDYFMPLCEKVVDLSLERDLVGLYLSLEKNFDPCLLVKENYWMDGLGNWTQAKWNQVNLTPK
jgi:hypothetical protein